MAPVDRRVWWAIGLLPIALLFCARSAEGPRWHSTFAAPSLSSGCSGGSVNESGTTVLVLHFDGGTFERSCDGDTIYDMLAIPNDKTWTAFVDGRMVEQSRQQLLGLTDGGTRYHFERTDYEDPSARRRTTYDQDNDASVMRCAEEGYVDGGWVLAREWACPAAQR